MRHAIAKAVLPASLIFFAAASALMRAGIEPFRTYFFLCAWWSYIFCLDAWLFLKGGESLFLEKPARFAAFLVPLSAFLWFVFEAFNLRLANWAYVGVPSETWMRWPGNFLAFGTVLPGIFLTANFLDHMGIFRKNEFSAFFSEPLPPRMRISSAALGAAMLLLPLAWPGNFFPLIWGGFVFLLDPIVAEWKGKSLIQEWRQKNFARTAQILLAGLFTGFLWELWNFWAGAKWVYTVPLPEALLKNFKIFEMPLLGFLGFPPFALECFVMTEFAEGLRGRVSPKTWRILGWTALAFMILMCRLMDLHTIRSFR